jgi:hypothetical protein
MSHLKTHYLSSNFRIVINNSKKIFEADIERQIESIWIAENAKRKIFNGGILSVDSFSESVIQVSISNYKYYLAQTLNKYLFEVLKIRSLAVSGVVSLGSKVVFGKRGKDLTQDPNKWELIPSGAVTAELSPSDQLVLELEEELGVAAEQVKEVRPFILIEDVESKVIDIGFEVELKSEGRLARSEEYSEILWIEKNKTRKFCDDRVDQIVPVSCELLKALNFSQI